MFFAVSCWNVYRFKNKAFFLLSYLIDAGIIALLNKLVLFSWRKIMKQNVIDCTLGYDLGNKTIASTVIDRKFNIMKCHHKLMTDTMIFTEAESKADRRTHRSLRRTYSHKKWEKKQMDRFFAVNASFDFAGVKRRFKNSSNAKKDPSRKQVLKPDLFLQDHDAYPNYWFAVDALLSKDKKRLPSTKAGVEQMIYEVFHRFLNQRGHSLTPELMVDQFIHQQFSFLDLGQSLQANLGLLMGSDFKLDLDRFNQVMLSGESSAKLYDDLTDLFGKDALVKIVTKGIAGYKISKKMLQQAFNAGEVVDLQFGRDNTDDQMDQLFNLLEDEQFNLIDNIYAAFMARQLTELQSAGQSFLDARLDDYKQYGQDTLTIKHCIAKHMNDNEVFHKASLKLKKAFNSYLHGHQGHGGKGSINYNQFLTELHHYLSARTGKINKVPYEIDLSDCLTDDDLERIKNGLFLQKTRSALNTRIPHQATQSIIRQIIDAWKNEFPYLARAEYVNNKWFKDEKYDLERFYDFQVPYYVGPLKEESKHSWIVRKEDGPLTVFNFTDKVDYAKTARAFIERMTGYDLLLIKDRVLPKSSLIYQKFEVLNELSNISIKPHKWQGWRKLNATEKSFLIGNQGPFVTGNKVSLKQLFSALRMRFNYFDNVEKKNCQYVIRGLSTEPEHGSKASFDNALSTRKQLVAAGLGESAFDLHSDDLEDIINILTVYDQNSYLIKKSELDKLAWLDEDVKDRLAKMSFTGWGRYSKRLLVGLKSPLNKRNVLENVEESSMNLQQVVTDPDLGFKQQIKEIAGLEMDDKTVQQRIELIFGPRFISPAVKKVLQKFARNLMTKVRWLGGQPARIVIESAREAKKQTTKNDTKYNRVKKIIKKLTKELQAEFKKLDKDAKFDDKTFLYFMQEGRDMYTGSSLGSLNDIISHPEWYDIDHIVPRSVLKDDSLDNRVLIKKTVNLAKTNDVLDRSVIKQQKALWLDFKSRGLVSAKKYHNLVTNWADDDLKMDFLNRSLVETNQINKLAKQIAEIICPDADVILLNSTVTTHLRRLDQQYYAQINRQLIADGKQPLSVDEIKKRYGDLELNIYKNREVNDLHHGVDSYLVAVGAQYLWCRYSWMRPWLKGQVSAHSKRFRRSDAGKKLTSYLAKHGISPAEIGFGEITDPSMKNKQIVNDQTGEIVTSQSSMQYHLKRVQNPDLFEDMLYESGPSLVGKAQVGKTTIHSAGHAKTMIRIHNNLDPQYYGFRQNETHRCFVLLYSQEKQRSIFVWLPYNREKLFMRDHDALESYVYAQLSASQRKTYKISSRILYIGSTLELRGTGFKFRLMGSCGDYRLVKQLILPNDDLRILNDREHASLDELKQVIHDITNYEKQNNYYLAALSPNNFKFWYSYTRFQEDVDNCDQKQDLFDLIDRLLVVFHCDGRKVKKFRFYRFEGAGTMQRQTWPGKLVESK